MASELCKARLDVGSFSMPALDALSGREAIGEPFRYVARGAVDLPLPATSKLLGAAATLHLEDAFGSRTIQGVVAEVETTMTDVSRGEVRIVLAPRTHLASVGRASRSFQDVSSIDAVEAVLSATGPIVRALSRSYPPTPYRVEREEDDWSFAMRTLAADGVTFHYDHDDGSTLVLTDDTRAAGAIAGLSVFPYHPDGLDVESEAIVQLSRHGAVTTGKVARRSFSWQNPDLSLAVTRGGGRYESYDAPGGGPADPAILEGAARDAEEALAAAAAGIAGEASTVRLFPGRTFTIAAASITRHDEPWFVEPWLVTSIEVELAGRRHAFVTRFTAIPRKVPFRPAPQVPTVGPRSMVAPSGGTQAGLSLSMVVASHGDEVFPDAHARVRSQMHWDRGGARDATAGTWMRVAQRCTSGSMMFPRAGWFVATLAEEGGVDAPGILSRIHDGERPPEYALPANKTRVVWKTATSPGGGSHNELHFEDAKGRENVFWNASRDMKVLVKADAAERIDNDAWHDVGVDQTARAGVSVMEQVQLTQTVTIGADQTTTVGSDRTKTVGKDDAVRVGGSRRLKVGDVSSLGVAGDRSLAVGAALIDVSLGQIGATASSQHTLVGGAVVRLSAKTYTEDASIASAELVGGAKIETAGNNRAIGVGKRLLETVGGLVRIDAGKRYVDTARKTSRWSVGGAMTGSTKELTLEGHASIEIRCGSSSIVLEPEEIRIEAKTLRLDGDELEAVTSVIVHNG